MNKYALTYSRLHVSRYWMYMCVGLLTCSITLQTAANQHCTPPQHTSAPASLALSQKENTPPKWLTIQLRRRRRRRRDDGCNLVRTLALVQICVASPLCAEAHACRRIHATKPWDVFCHSFMGEMGGGGSVSDVAAGATRSINWNLLAVTVCVCVCVKYVFGTTLLSCAGGAGRQLECDNSSNRS